MLNDDLDLDLSSFPLLRIDQLKYHETDILILSERELSSLLSSIEATTNNTNNDDEQKPSSSNLGLFANRLLSSLRDELSQRGRNSNDASSSSQPLIDGNEITISAPSTSAPTSSSSSIPSTAVPNALDCNERQWLTHHNRHRSGRTTALSLPKRSISPSSQNIPKTTTTTTSNSTRTMRRIIPFRSTSQQQHPPTTSIKQKQKKQPPPPFLPPQTKTITSFTVGSSSVVNGGGGLRQRAKAAQLSLKKRKEEMFEQQHHPSSSRRDDRREMVRRERRQLAMVRMKERQRRIRERREVEERRRQKKEEFKKKEEEERCRQRQERNKTDDRSSPTTMTVTDETTASSMTPIETATITNDDREEQRMETTYASDSGESLSDELIEDDDDGTINSSNVELETSATEEEEESQRKHYHRSSSEEKKEEEESQIHLFSTMGDISTMDRIGEPVVNDDDARSPQPDNDIDESMKTCLTETTVEKKLLPKDDDGDAITTSISRRMDDNHHGPFSLSMETENHDIDDDDDVDESCHDETSTNDNSTNPGDDHTNNQATKDTDGVGLDELLNNVVEDDERRQYNNESIPDDNSSDNNDKDDDNDRHDDYNADRRTPSPDNAIIIETTSNYERDHHVETTKTTKQKQHYPFTECYPDISLIFTAFYNDNTPTSSPKKQQHRLTGSKNRSKLLSCLEFHGKLNTSFERVMNDYADAVGSSSDDGHSSIGRNPDDNDDDDESTRCVVPFTFIGANYDTKMIVSSSPDSTTKMTLQQRYFRVSSNRPEVSSIVNDSLSSSWTELPAGLGLGPCWNLLWTWSKPKVDFESLLVFQKINHFRRSKYLARKDCLKKKIQRLSYHSATFRLMLPTFALPREYNAFVSAFTAAQRGDKNNDDREVKEDNNNNTVSNTISLSSSSSHHPNFWIMKPIGLSRGRGISLTNDIGSISYSSPIVIQKYLSHPLLLLGYKFDLRVYVLVTSFSPLEAFVYREGFARFASRRYTVEEGDMKDERVHLTNASLQSGYFARGDGGVQEDHPVRMAEGEGEGGGNKVSLSWLWRYIDREHGTTTSVSKRMWNDVKDMCLKTLLSVEDEMTNEKPNSFEVYGFDIIFDCDRRPWLIEVNSSPAMTRESPLDYCIKGNMIRDTIRLLDPARIDRMALIEVCRRRRREMMNGERRNMTIMTPHCCESDRLENDLRRILMDRIPRKYGDMPRESGDYERLAPGTSQFLRLMKLKKRLMGMAVPC